MRIKKSPILYAPSQRSPFIRNRFCRGMGCRVLILRLAESCGPQPSTTETRETSPRSGVIFGGSRKARPPQPPKINFTRNRRRRTAGRYPQKSVCDANPRLAARWHDVFIAHASAHPAAEAISDKGRPQRRLVLPFVRTKGNGYNNYGRLRLAESRGPQPPAAEARYSLILAVPAGCCPNNRSRRR